MEECTVKETNGLGKLIKSPVKSRFRERKKEGELSQYINFLKAYDRHIRKNDQTFENV